jgi:anthranilate synthase component 1
MTPHDLEARVTPSRQELKREGLVGRHGQPATHVALRLSLAIDTETPIGLYHKLSGQRPGSFLLESAETGDRGSQALRRWSFIGFDVAKTLSSGDGGRDPLDGIADELQRYVIATLGENEGGLPPFRGGAVGYLGYDVVRHFERVPLPRSRSLDVPDAQVMITEEIAAFDHLLGRLHLIVLVPTSGDRNRSFDRALSRLAELVGRLEGPPPAPRMTPREAPPLPPTISRSSRESFEQSVRTAKEAIAAGEVFQIVLSQRFTVEAAVDPFALYRSLRSLNPSPYMFLLRFPTHAIVGASPEVLVRTSLTREGTTEVLVRPIAGTRRRGNNVREDEQLEVELRADPKELAEHRMLLDLGRNDVGRVARIGTVQVERPLHIERYSHVMHLVSDVRGELREDLDAFDVFRACFPAGTVSGAPKIRAMEIIAKLEPERRNSYAGAVGYFGFDGQSDTCIAIRTVVVEKERAHLQAGAGIIFDSVPATEHEECLSKARAPLTAIALALAEQPPPVAAEGVQR